MKHKNEQSIDKLTLVNSALKSMPLPDENSVDWEIIETNVFAELDKKRIVAFRTHTILSIAAALILTFSGLFYIYNPISLTASTRYEIIKSSGLLFGASTGSKLFEKEELTQTGYIRTGAESFALFKSITGMEQFSLEEQTSLFVKKALVDDQEVLLQEGTITVNLIKNGTKRRFSVVTPNASCTAFGTVFKVRVYNTDIMHTVLNVLSGTVAVATSHDTSYVNAPDCVIIQSDSIIPLPRPSASPMGIPAHGASKPVMSFQISSSSAPALLSENKIDLQEQISPPDISLLEAESRKAAQFLANKTVHPDLALLQSESNKVAQPKTSKSEINANEIAKASIASSKKVLAGHLEARSFYWLKENMKYDTLQWDLTLSTLLKVDSNGFTSPENSQSLAFTKGKAFYKVIKPTALTVHLLSRINYPLIVLSQWSGAVEVTKDMRGKNEDNVFISNYLWEYIDKTRVSTLGTTGGDYEVTIDFQNAGFSRYKGKQNVILSRSQILGTSGFEISDHTKDQTIEGNMHRQIIAFYIMADADSKESDIVKALEKQMDALHLDISYTVPSIKRIAP